MEDVARATLLLMESNITEERFIVNGDTWPFKKLQDTIADGFGKKRPSQSNYSVFNVYCLENGKIEIIFSPRKNHCSQKKVPEWPKAKLILKTIKY